MAGLELRGRGYPAELLRRRLGAGDHLEVMAPPELRRIVAAQTCKAAALY